MARENPRLRFAVDALTTAAVLATCALLIWQNWPKPTRPAISIPSEPMTLEGVARKGSPEAPLVVIEFSDFQCPYCRRFADETLPNLQKDYISTGRVQFAFRHLPIEQIHSHARGAAAASICAGEQDRFWEMHDVLFANPKALDLPSIQGYGTKLGLDGMSFQRCLADPLVQRRIAFDMDQAKALRITGTPAFLIGRALPGGKAQVMRALPGAVSGRPFKKSSRMSFTAALLGCCF